MEGGGGSGRRSISLDVRSMVQVPVRDGFNAFEKKGGRGGGGWGEWNSPREMSPNANVGNLM